MTAIPAIGTFHVTEAQLHALGPDYELLSVRVTSYGSAGRSATRSLSDGPASMHAETMDMRSSSLYQG